MAGSPVHPDPQHATARFWIDSLALEPHPEGGYYKETYRDSLVLQPSSLTANFRGPRSASTAIYFLLEAGQFSAFHRIPSDELWHFYAGGPLVVHILDSDGHYTQLLLGSDPGAGQQFQGVAKGNSWFASELLEGSAFALVGCTVAPGFAFEDFELAERESLAATYPQYRALIERLTR